jgi:2-polyprenyl-6-methoxyphenol hydroxylase-like FAD-dependent oxidoreductase
VRAQLHGSIKPTYAGYTAWRAVVRFDLTQLVPGESWGSGARFGHLPMTQDRVYWYATSNEREGERKPGNEKAGLARIFRGWHAPIEALIDATDESAIFRNDIYDRRGLSKWGEGRVTLLGDAAHPMTPNLGQGACQAFEDAVVLARCLSGSPDAASALADYEAQRIPRANWLVDQSRQIGTIGQWQHPIGITLRNALIKLLSPRLQQRQLERIIRYEF